MLPGGQPVDKTTRARAVSTATATLPLASEDTGTVTRPLVIEDFPITTR